MIINLQPTPKQGRPTHRRPLQLNGVKGLDHLRRRVDFRDHRKGAGAFQGGVGGKARNRRRWLRDGGKEIDFVAVLSVDRGGG